MEKAPQNPQTGSEDLRPEREPQTEKMVEKEQNPEKEKLFEDVEMKVEVTNICSGGRCSFCSPLFRPTVNEAGSKEFLNKMDENLENYLRGGGRKIILTGGGEPVDAPAKLFGTLDLINKKKKELGIALELLTVYSNGVSLLKPESEGSDRTILDKLVDHGVQDINISVHGLTKEERTAISGEQMGNIDFDTLIPWIVEKGVRVMTRTTLAKGFIDSVDKIEEFTKWMSGLGVRMIYFSDLFKVPIRDERTTPGSKTVLEWTDEHRADFDKILEDVKNSKEFELISEFTRHHQQGRTFEFKHKESGVKVMLGDLIIGDESEEVPTYAYVKPDGSMDAHNNAREWLKREFVDLVQIRKYRPGRSEPEFQ
jgi:molybdenum cofactor biosynthesis enzyme MoaA